MNGKKMTKKNSSRLFVAGILTAAICLAFSVAATSDTHYSIEIIEVNGGYGYQISYNNHITIFQPFIPAISGKKPFMEKEDAKKVGKLVMRRMKTGENYTVTRHELEIILFPLFVHEKIEYTLFFILFLCKLYTGIWNYPKDSLSL